MNSETNILIAPVGSIKLKDKQALKKDGVIVIESDNPESFKMIRPQSELSHTDMLYAAMTAIQKGDDTTTKSVFAKTVAQIVISERDNANNPPTP